MDICMMRLTVTNAKFMTKMHFSGRGAARETPHGLIVCLVIIFFQPVVFGAEKSSISPGSQGQFPTTTQAPCPKVFRISNRGLEAGSIPLAWSISGNENRIEYYAVRYKATKQLACKPPYLNEAYVTQPNVTGPKMVTIRGLQPYTGYVVEIAAKCSESGSDQWISREFRTFPSAPPMLHATVRGVGSTSLRLEWNPLTCSAVNGVFKDYTSVISDGNGYIKNETLTIRSSSSATFTTLDPCTNYTLSLSATNHGRQGTLQGPVSTLLAQTTAEGPSKPPNRVELTDSSYYSLTFSWDKPRCGSRNGPITDYEYILYTKGSIVSIDGKVTANAGGGNLTINDLIPSTTYYFRVRANNYDLPGDYGREIEANTTIAVYLPVRNINVTKLTETTAVVEWISPQPSNLTMTEYRVRCWTRNRKEYTIIVVSCETDSCRPNGVMNITIIGLRPATNNSIKVIAVYKYGEKASSVMVFQTLEEVYPPPRNINVTPLTETTAVVEWDTPLPSEFNITGYRIEYCMTNRNEKTRIEISCEKDSCYPARVMEEIITGLRAGTNYSIEVIAVYKNEETASNTMVFEIPGEEVGSFWRRGQFAMIPVLVIIFLVIIVLVLVVASKLYLRKTNKQLFKWPGLFAFSRAGCFNSLRRTDTSNNGSAQTPSSHTTREVNGDGMEMNATCHEGDVSQTGSHVCNTVGESDLSSSIYQSRPLPIAGERNVLLNERMTTS